MSGLHHFDTDPDEMANCLDFCGGGEFDFEREFISEDHEYEPIHALSRGLSSPNPSDGSATAEQSALMDATNKDQNFPVLLHEIVSSEEFDCIQWLPCGSFFVISDKDAFTKQVIPRFFDARGGTKFTSFTRRLKRWMFNRVSSGANIGAYHHEMFRRGEPELAAAIVYPAKVKNKNSPTGVVKAKVKAQRRASTGCIVDSGKDMEIIGCTPIPVKPSVMMSTTPVLPELDSDMAAFLASPEFIKDEEPFSFEHPKTASSAPVSPVFSVPNLPAPVSICSSKNTLSPVQSQKMQQSPVNSPTFKQLISAYQPKHKAQVNLPMQSQSLLQNAQMNIMNMRPLAYPAGLNVWQQQQQQHQVFTPQMRRHSCMPMFSNVTDPTATSMFGAGNVPTGVYSNSSLNPMLQINNMCINQNMINMNVKNTSLSQRGGGSSGEFNGRDQEKDDKWIDFDEFVARNEDDPTYDKEW